MLFTSFAPRLQLIGSLSTLGMGGLRVAARFDAFAEVDVLTLEDM